MKSAPALFEKLSPAPPAFAPARSFREAFLSIGKTSFSPDGAALSTRSVPRAGLRTVKLRAGPVRGLTGRPAEESEMPNSLILCPPQIWRSGFKNLLTLSFQLSYIVAEI